MAGFRSQVLGIAFCILLWNDRISYADLDEWNRKNQPGSFEAATIDGANKPQQFRYMTMPLLKGVFKTNIYNVDSKYSSILCMVAVVLNGYGR